MSKPRFIMEFLLMAGQRKTERRVCVPVGYVWQEGPDDMHVQLDGPGGDNIWPKIDAAGYYVIPNPRGLGTVRAYHIGFYPEGANMGKCIQHDSKFIASLIRLWGGEHYFPTDTKTNKGI